jgi:hypothetical protein
LKSRKRPLHRIEVFVDRIEQLFNSMDPSPFHERDLDDDAEEFIVGKKRRRLAASSRSRMGMLLPISKLLG